MKTDKIGDIIGYWLGNRKNVMDFNLLEKGIQDLLDKQKEEVISYIGLKQGWEESEDIYRKHFGLKTKY